MNMSKTPLEGGSTFKIDLYITGTAVYNCPDSNDVNPYFDSFKLFYKNLDLNSLEYTKYSEENNNPIISQETSKAKRLLQLTRILTLKLFPVNALHATKTI